MPATSARRPPNGRDGNRWRPSRGRWKPRRRTSSTCVGQTLSDHYPGLLTGTGSVDISTTLDSYLQRSRRRPCRPAPPHRRPAGAQAGCKGQAQIALVALDPRTRRHPRVHRRPLVRPVPVQPPAERPAPARLGVQAVRLPGRVRVGGRRRPHRHHAGHPRQRRAVHVRLREPGLDAAQLRGRVPTASSRCAARWRSRATWPRCGWRRWPASAGSPVSGSGSDSSMVPKPYPSIALGVFEATPMEVASAYTIFANGGEMRPLRAIARLESGGAELPIHSGGPRADRPRGHDVPRHQHAAKRGQRRHGGRGTRDGFQPRRGGQDRHDQRPSRCLVRRLHARAAHGRVGRIRRQPAGQPQRIAGRAPHLDPLHDGRAGSGRPNAAFAPPPGIVFVAIDRDTGRLAQPGCPRILREAFIAGTEPTEACELHRF